MLKLYFKMLRDETDKKQELKKKSTKRNHR